MSVRVVVVDAATTTGLRRAVLRPSWAPGTVMPGDADPDALHLAAFGPDGADGTDGAVIGTCVLFAARCPHHPDVEGAWQLRGMATAEWHRSEGVGAAVVGRAVELVRDRAATLLWCKARVTAQPFYAAHGFVVDTDEYVEPQTGLPHRDMSRAV